MIHYILLSVLEIKSFLGRRYIESLTCKSNYFNVNIALYPFSVLIIKDGAGRRKIESLKCIRNYINVYYALYPFLAQYRIIEIYVKLLYIL